jgi:hypothetical protein
MYIIYSESLICGYTEVEAVLWVGEELTTLYIRTLLSAWITIRENGSNKVVLILVGCMYCASFTVNYPYYHLTRMQETPT